MNGLGGNDLLYVDTFGDVVIEGAGGGSDRVFAASSYALGAGVHVEILSTTNNAGTGAINLAGNALVNSIAGNNGANVLDGGGGSDTLNGLGGADTFRFTTALGAGNVDTVVGYLVGRRQDRDRQRGVRRAGRRCARRRCVQHRRGRQPGRRQDHLQHGHRALLFDADGSGAGAAVQFAALSAGLAMTASEFVVI